MKQYKSSFLKLVSIVFLGFPIFYIVIAAVGFDMSLGSCTKVLLSPFYYLVSFCAVLAGFGLWEMRRWSWYVLILSQILIGYENAILVSTYAESHHKVFVYIASLLLQLIILFRISREVRVPYFFPKIRWWESNPLYRLSLPVEFERTSGEVIKGEILDLSMLGCFIRVRSDLIADEQITLTFQAFGTKFSTVGVVIWVAQSSVTYPKGIGVKFESLVRSQKRILKLITLRLARISKLYRRSRYLMSEEEFYRALKELEMMPLVQEKTTVNGIRVSEDEIQGES